MTTFYDPDYHPGKTFLPEDESRHAIKSLRLRPGESFQVTNGMGMVIKATMTDYNGRQLNFEIKDFEERKKTGPLIHMAVSPLKQADRFEFFIEKATELGVDEITPLICHRTERFREKKDRLQRIMISALKQSGNAFLPKLNEAIGFSEFLSNAAASEKLIGHLEDGKRQLIGDLDFNADSVIAIGPEGDFTREELDAAFKSGFKAISFGSLTLRTETAAIVAVTAFQLKNSP